MLSMGPEIEVFRDVVGGEPEEIYDGSSCVYFNSTAVGSPVSKTLNITNTGAAVLTLDANPPSLPSGFSVVTMYDSSLAPEESTQLVIQLDAVAEGFYDAYTSLGNNDADENPFDLYISGEVTGG